MEDAEIEGLSSFLGSSVFSLTGSGLAFSSGSSEGTGSSLTGSAAFSSRVESTTTDVSSSELEELSEIYS
ncbi:hypothetical protein D3C87_1795240 [compost metagenome]